MPERRIVTIIPAKGTSSRLKKKNIRLLNGKPLLSYTIDTALKWGQSNCVFVNSEDDEILNIAREFGAAAYKRPLELSSGDVLAVEVIKEQIRTMKMDLSDIVILLQVTCPLRKVIDIQNAFHIFKENGMMSGVVSVTEYEKPPELAFYIDERNRLKRKYPTEFHLLSQRHSSAYRYNTCLVINTAQGFLQQDDTVGKDPMPYVMPHERSVDIDYDYQFTIAELLVRAEGI